MIFQSIVQIHEQLCKKDCFSNEALPAVVLRSMLLDTTKKSRVLIRA